MPMPIPMPTPTPIPPIHVHVHIHVVKIHAHAPLCVRLIPSIPRWCVTPPDATPNIELLPLDPDPDPDPDPDSNPLDWMRWLASFLRFLARHPLMNIYDQLPTRDSWGGPRDEVMRL